jgi:hypothetical protein
MSSYKTTIKLATSFEEIEVKFPLFFVSNNQATQYISSTAYLWINITDEDIYVSYVEMDEYSLSHHVLTTMQDDNFIACEKKEFDLIANSAMIKIKEKSNYNYWENKKNS